MAVGVTPSELSKYFPLLYHMAHRESWEGMKRHGLLCTESLLKLFEVSPAERASILNQQRTESFTIQHPKHGQAVIRDQKPLIRSRLEPVLQDCTFDQWLAMLNSRVFFWLTEARLQTLMCTREYCPDTHVVLIADTKRLATDCEKRITLAPMNTGNTRPIAHKRGLSTFGRMNEYPFQSRRERRLELVVELAIEGGVPNIVDYLVEAAEMQCSQCESKDQTIQKTRTIFP